MNKLYRVVTSRNFKEEGTIIDFCVQKSFDGALFETAHGIVLWDTGEYESVPVDDLLDADKWGDNRHEREAVDREPYSSKKPQLGPDGRPAETDDPGYGNTARKY